MQVWRTSLALAAHHLRNADSDIRNPKPELSLVFDKRTLYLYHSFKHQNIIQKLKMQAHQHNLAIIFKQK